MEIEKKQSKIIELNNLISQYDTGEREKINVDEYPTWVTIREMLIKADIADNIFDDFIANPSHYKIVNNEIIYNENWEQEQKEAEEKAEQERKSKLKMTKRDFFLYIVQPYGVTYSALMEALKANDTIYACYEGCNHIYRYDEMLVGNIKPMLEQLTGTTIDEDELNALLDKAFEERNEVI